MKINQKSQMHHVQILTISIYMFEMKEIELGAWQEIIRWWHECVFVCTK